ncbi:hypothetical protein BJ166DRAFT_510715 [Pestalotiopsis sp. NC0098]|nr:hypothetical protein BJ166DRAFT_510715 [Pestalotiopsis sp. NC0098]
MVHYLAVQIGPWSPLAKRAFMCLCLFSEGHLSPIPHPPTPLVCSWQQWGWNQAWEDSNVPDPTDHSQGLCKN